MKKKLTIHIAIILFCLLFSIRSFSQNVGINTTGTSPDSSAMLDISSTDKGLLIPRMDSTSRKNIVTPAKGLMVFDSTYNSFYFHNGTNWTSIGGGSDNLGNHTANQNLQLNNNWLNNDGDTNEGIYVDSSGQVGIGITPSANFHVSMGKVSEVNASMTTPDWFYGGDVCQSFTPTKNGELQSIELSTQGTTAVTYNLYEGEGTGGTLIAGPLNQTNPQSPYLFSGVTLVQGQPYTIEVLNPTGMTFYLDQFSDIYPGGRACYSFETDFWFKVNMLVDKPGLSISETQIQINNYSIPVTDGATGQVLQTDGAGNVNWATPAAAAAADNQDLSLSGHTLNLTNDPTPVNLSGYLDNTDVQDLNLSGTTLSLTNDATAVDLSGFANTDNQDLSLSGDILSLTNDASTVDLSGYANTDTQDLSLSGNTLSLTNDGTTVDLSGYLDNTDTDEQDLSLSGNILSLTNDGTTVDLSSFAGGADNMGNHSATQNVQLNGNWLNNDGSADKGLNIDNAGQVGINTIPTSTFHVDMGAAQVVNPISVTHNNSTLVDNFEWQSFTATINGPLDSVSINLDNPNGDAVIYRLLSGEGTGGVITYQNTVTPTSGNNAFTFSGVTLQKDAVYTLSLTFLVTSTITFYYNSTNPYSGGISSNNAAWDMDFTAHMTQGNAGFRVGNNGVTINEYVLPSNDGDANQVLTTNGAGNVSWTSAAGGSDNLGNHTATQNLTIGSNAIQNNASGANGLSMGSYNQLLVESNFQRTGFFTSTGVTVFGASLGNYIEVNNKAGTRSIFGADGEGVSSGTDTLNTVIGNWTTGGAMTFHINAGTKAMTLGSAGRLGIGRTAATNLLEVEGNASKSTAGDWLANSDARLKKNITSLSSDDMLEKMLSLQGVTYEWNDNKTNTKRPKGVQYGFTAQNIQAIFPSLVTEDNNGFLQTPYGTYDAMTVEAIRALNDKIEQLESEKATLQSQVQQLQSQNQQLAINTTELDELKNAFAELKTQLKKTPSKNSEGAINSEE